MTTNREALSMRAACILAIASFSGALQAQDYNTSIAEPFEAPGGSMGRESDGGFGIETIDPFTGALKIVVTDVVVPSNGGLDLSVTRSYQSYLRASSDASRAYQKGRMTTGIGWDLHYGRLWQGSNHISATTLPATNSAQGCQTTNVAGDTRFNPVLELPDGVRRQFVIAHAGASYAYISEDRWLLKCLPTGSTSNPQGFGGAIVVSPEGVEYTFNFRNRVSDQPISTNIVQSPSNFAFHVTRIQHPNGTYLTISYVPETQAFLAVISSVTHSEGGSITFGYDNVSMATPTTIRLRSFTSAGRTWNYNYVAAPGLTGRSYLESVVRPDGRRTQYTYYMTNGSAGAFSLRQVTTPLGGEVEYTYTTQTFPVRDALVTPPSSYVVRTKEVRRGGGAANKTWYYNYRPASGSATTDSTDVKGPFSCETYEHQSSTAQTTVWRHGLLLNKAIHPASSSPSGNGACSGTLLYRETLTWESMEVTPGTNNSPQGRFQKPLVFDNVVNVPRLSRRVVRLDGTDYTTDYEDPDIYGSPQRIVETGREPSGNGNYVTAQRRTDVSYFNNTSRWIIGRREDETIVNAGYVYPTPTSAQTLVNYVVARDYYTDNRVGLVESETRAGVTTNYNYYTGSSNGGELSTATDANGVATSTAGDYTTSYSNYVRGTPETVSRAIDAAGTLQTVTVDVNSTGTIASETDGAGKTTGYLYNDVNLIRNVTTHRTDDADVSVTRTSSNTNDVIIRGNYREVRQYDGFGKLFRTDWMVNGSTTLIHQTFEYDAAGRLVKRFPPNGGSPITIDYDALDRVTSVTRPGAGTTSYEYLSDSRVVVTDERSFVTRHFYRAFGDPMRPELMLIRAPRGTSTGDGLVRQTHIQRNLLGNVTFISQGAMNSSGTIDSPVTREYRYNSRFFLFDEIQPEMGTIRYGHDQMGNVVSRTVGGLTTNYTLDRLYRTDLITFPGTTGTVDFAYYGNDLLQYVIKGAVRWDYSYDGNNNLTNETLALSGPTFNPARTFTYINEFNDKDVLKSITYPEYPAAGSLKVDYAPDALGRATRVDAWHGGAALAPIATSISYHPNGALNAITLGNGVTTTYTQDVLLRPRNFSAAATLNGSLHYFVNRQYGYDASSNVNLIDDFTAANGDKSMFYDGLNRLRTSNGPWGSGTITYHPNDNFETMSFSGSGSIPAYSVTTSYDPASNRLSGLSGSRIRSGYAYDAYGNVTYNGGDTFSSARFTFDDDSLLRTARTDSNNLQFEYTYDGNRRVAKEFDATTATTRYKATNKAGLLLFEEDIDNAFTKDHVFIGDRLISTRTRCTSAIDSDGDGISNCIEAKLGMLRNNGSDASGDADQDGLSNLVEVQSGTDIYRADTDADGLSDNYERSNGLIAYVSDSNSDSDSDGLSNMAEYQAGTKPNDADTDNDGLPDGSDPNPRFNPAILAPIFQMLLGD